MDVLLGIAIEAIFAWWQLGNNSLFIAYPSKGTVIQVCVDETQCWVPKEKIEVIQMEYPVGKVTITREYNGKYCEETLVRSPLPEYDLPPSSDEGDGLQTRQCRFDS